MTRYNVFIENTKMHDTAKSIFLFLITKRFNQKKITLEDFIQEIQHNIWRLFGIGIQINHDISLNDKCEQLMNQLIEHQLIVTNN